jgi:hypothetical protein
LSDTHAAPPTTEGAPACFAARIMQATSAGII